MAERILITGGAGFIGSNLALSFKRDHPSATVIAFDNLKRRGSELALSRLRTGGVEFMHGDNPIIWSTPIGAVKLNDAANQGGTRRGE